MKTEQLMLNYGREVQMRKDTFREEYIATHLMKSSTGESCLMESICERENMNNALRRVEQNDGAPGIDKMKVTRLRGFLRRTGKVVKTALLTGHTNLYLSGRSQLESLMGEFAYWGFPRFWIVSFNRASRRYCKRFGSTPFRRIHMDTVRDVPKLKR